MRCTERIDGMRPWILAIALSIAAGSAGAQPVTLTSIHSVHNLTREQAAEGRPVAFEATVTYYSKSDVNLFVQQDGEAIYIETPQNQNLLPGDRVLVKGTT